MPLIGQNNLNNPAHCGGSILSDAFVAGENPEDFFTLLHDHFSFYQPATAIEAELVSDVVIARWLLDRRERACSDAASDPARFAFLLRYEIRAGRAVKRALKLLHTHQKQTLKEQKRQLAEAQRRQRMEQQLQRLEALKAKQPRVIPAATAPVQPDRVLAVIKPNPVFRRKRDAGQ